MAENNAIAPMSTREAIEAMKIVAPHCRDLVLASDSVALMRILWQRVSGESPVQLLRLVALMEHKTVEAVADEYEARRDAAAFILRMAEGFARNPLDLMVNAAFHVGLNDAVWSRDGSRNS